MKKRFQEFKERLSCLIWINSQDGLHAGFRKSDMGCHLVQLIISETMVSFKVINKCCFKEEDLNI